MQVGAELRTFLILPVPGPVSSIVVISYSDV
jgi:hypothetical protein